MAIQCIISEDGKVDLKVPVNDQRLIAKAIGKLKAARIALEANPKLKGASFDGFYAMLDVINDHVQNGPPASEPDTPPPVVSDHVSDTDGDGESNDINF